MDRSSRALRVRRMCRSIFLLVGVALASGCTPPDAPTGVIEVGLAGRGVVMPRGAEVDVGTSGPGLDDGVPFFAFRSPLAPIATRVAYAEDLARAGYQGRGEDDGWSMYVRGVDRLAVRIADAGPPTSIIVKVLPAVVAGDPDRPSPRLPRENSLGTPEPPHGPALTDPSPAATGDGRHGSGHGAGGGGQGQGPGTGNGSPGDGTGNGASGNGTGNGASGNGGEGGQGHGNGNGAASGNGAARGNGHPTTTPATTSGPTPTATPKPKPTQKPKPTPKPRATPRPTPGGRGPDGSGPPGAGRGDGG